MGDYTYRVVIVNPDTAACNSYTLGSYELAVHEYDAFTPAPGVVVKLIDSATGWTIHRKVGN